MLQYQYSWHGMGYWPSKKLEPPSPRTFTPKRSCNVYLKSYIRVAFPQQSYLTKILLCSNNNVSLMMMMMMMINCFCGMVDRRKVLSLIRAGAQDSKEAWKWSLKSPFNGTNATLAVGYYVHGKAPCQIWGSGTLCFTLW